MNNLHTTFLTVLLVFWAIGCNKEALTVEAEQPAQTDALCDSVERLNAELNFRISYMESLSVVRKNRTTPVPINPVSDTTKTH